MLFASLCRFSSPAFWSSGKNSVPAVWYVHVTQTLQIETLTTGGWSNGMGYKHACTCSSMSPRVCPTPAHWDLPKMWNALDSFVDLLKYFISVRFSLWRVISFGCDAVYSGINRQMFRRNVLLLSSESNSKPGSKTFSSRLLRRRRCMQFSRNVGEFLLYYTLLPENSFIFY